MEAPPRWFVLLCGTLESLPFGMPASTLREPVRFMNEIDDHSVEVVCPCCGARLAIDAALGQVVSHEAPHRQAKAPELDHASELLEQQAARREAHFRQSAEVEKVKSQVLERRFEEALKKTHGTPATRPLREIDLD